MLFGAAVDDSVYVVGFEHRFAVDDDVVTLDGYHFAGVLVNEVFHPGAQYPCGQLAAYGLLRFARFTFTSSARSNISSICWSFS